MQDNGISTERLMFIEADLSQDEHWDEAMKDCKYVLSWHLRCFLVKQTMQK